MKDTQGWHRGRPPAVGWFPASSCRNSNILRFWNGKHWSCYAQEFNTKSEAGFNAKGRAFVGSIEWQHQPRSWPKNARTYVRTDNER